MCSEKQRCCTADLCHCFRKCAKPHHDSIVLLGRFSSVMNCLDITPKYTCCNKFLTAQIDATTHNMTKWNAMIISLIGSLVTNLH